jgi:AcrR family transcriptional regulator
MHDNCPTGLRERKKAATRLAIERAAVNIAYEQGYEATTAEAIATKADVSLRTFFNYFPSKDIAIGGTGLPPIDESRAHRILEDSGVDLLKGIARVAEACATDANPSSELMRRRRRLTHENPSLFHLHVNAEVQFDGWLAGVVAEHLRMYPWRRRLGEEVAVEEEARLAVTVVSSAVHYHVRRAIENDVDATLSEKDIERTIGMMAQIHQKDS